MRLTCPICSTQYEVPDEVIPDSGRDVQCSNCEQTWFQVKDPQADAPIGASASEAGKAVEEVAVSEVAGAQPDNFDEPAKGNVDPAVANILKEEAVREAKMREREGTNLESQPNLALDPPEELKVKPKRPTATETAEDPGQKDVLPDVVTINSGLRSDLPSDNTEAVVPARNSNGFLRGFALIVIIGFVLFLIYDNSTKISDAVPQAEPVLKSYVSLVDEARLWFEAQTSGGAQN